MTDHAFSETERRAVYRAIFSRRDMRRFVPGTVVDEEVLGRILAAAHSAPSVGLMQPWRFIRITDSVLRKKIHALVDAERRRTAEEGEDVDAVFRAVGHEHELVDRIEHGNLRAALATATVVGREGL